MTLPKKNNIKCNTKTLTLSPHPTLSNSMVVFEIISLFLGSAIVTAIGRCVYTQRQDELDPWQILKRQMYIPPRTMYNSCLWGERVVKYLDKRVVGILVVQHCPHPKTMVDIIYHGGYDIIHLNMDSAQETKPGWFQRMLHINGDLNHIIPDEHTNHPIIIFIENFSHHTEHDKDAIMSLAQQSTFNRKFVIILDIVLPCVANKVLGWNNGAKIYNVK
jgi:hypothetical protein